ncbi:MAG: PAS domain-containing protein, partial [Planctomycetota bacterium]|nr:PAS domain-containing protein [Planctomycetota bacterium]
MIDAEKICELFPFSIQIDSDLNIEFLGRSLAKRIPQAQGVPFADLFDVQRLAEAFDVDWIRQRTGRPVLLALTSMELTLNGAFQQVGEGFVFFGGPRIEDVDQLNPLGLSIDDFAAHDGIMSNLFLLQQMKTASDEAVSAAKKLAMQERRYRQIVEESNDIILITDRNGLLILANPAAHKLLQIEPGVTVMNSLLFGDSTARWREANSGLDADHSHWVELSLRGRGDSSVTTEGHLVPS